MKAVQYAVAMGLRVVAIGAEINLFLAHTLGLN